MSYEIIKGIRVDKNSQEVWIKSDSNNVVPKLYSWWHSKSLSDIYKKNGLEKVEKKLLREFWGGNFQGSELNYEKSLVLLDYKKYNWDTVGDIKGAERFGVFVKYTYEELEDVLYENYLKFKERKKGDFVIVSKVEGGFVKKITKRYTYFMSNVGSAKLFRSREDALYYLTKRGRSKKEYIIKEKGDF